jgi:membrane-associated phospholipid phosphatase
VIWARFVKLGLVGLLGLAWGGAQVFGAGLPQDPGTQENAETARKMTEAHANGGQKESAQRAGGDRDSEPTAHHGLIGAGRDFLEDQKQIWTSPARLRVADANWLIPIGGFAAGLLATDGDVSRHLSNDPSTISRAKTMSLVGVGALAGTAGAMWLLSYPEHRAHWRETGFLAGEAAIDSFVAVEAMKYTLGRERPYQGDGTGPFFSGGTSFPSEHAAAAWSIAGVIAHEYPGVFPKIAAYGLASLVSYSRIRGRQHFPSDVLIGQLMGQMIAQDVYSRRYDPELGGGAWRPMRELFRVDSPSRANHGSPYVPLDSWIYEALDRLGGMGLLPGGYVGMRPWTRGECARLVSDAQDRAAGESVHESEAAALVDLLEREFRSENHVAEEPDRGTIRVESLYSRVENISGMPLTDGYHFAQTQYNDFGRPYGEGWSTASGFSAYASAGRWVGYVRAELQTAPQIPALPLTAREFVSHIDILPEVAPDTPQASTQRVKLLDAYVGWMLSNWEITFGKQTLMWGAGDGGSMMISDNIEPINMFRVNRVTPLKLPWWLFGWLGPMRMEFFLGQVGGHEFISSPQGFIGQFGVSLDPQPFIHGERISFKPTKNFEFGISRTTIYGGPGYPLTLHTFARSLFSTGNEVQASPDKPGDRRSGFDFSYHLPKLRNWLTFYGDGFTDDQLTPIAYPDRSVWRAGLFLSHLPRIPKLDLRVEGVYTNNPLGGKICCGFFYSNGTWRTGYRNDGNLIGNWIGRDGQGAQAWTNYWFTPRNRLQINFRHQKVGADFVPQGGSLTDVGVRGDYWLRSNLSLSGAVTFERWLFPVIQANRSNTVSSTVQISFQPEKMWQRATKNSGDVLTVDQP